MPRSAARNAAVLTLLYLVMLVTAAGNTAMQSVMPSIGTELGIEAKRYMDAGEYVPDEVTNLMVRNRIDDVDRGLRL